MMNKCVVSKETIEDCLHKIKFGANLEDALSEIQLLDPYIGSLIIKDREIIQYQTNRRQLYRKTAMFVGAFNKYLTKSEQKAMLNLVLQDISQYPCVYKIYSAKLFFHKILTGNRLNIDEWKGFISLNFQGFGDSIF